MINIIEKIKNISQEKKVVFKNFTALGIIQLLNYVLPFITLPYLSRVLTVDKFGLIFFAQVVIEYFNRITMFGFNNSGVRQIALYREDKNRVNIVFNSAIIIQIMLLGLCFIILVGLIIFSQKFRTDAIIYYFTFLSTIGNILLFTWFYQGMEKMSFITMLNIITRTISIVAIFLFVKEANDYLLVPLFNSFGILSAGIVSLFVITRKFGIKFKLPPFKEIIFEFKYSSEFFLAIIAVALYRQTNSFILGISMTTTAVAYFIAADKIFMAIYMLYSNFINALFPYMTKNKDVKFFNKVLKYTVILGIGLTIFLLIFAKPIIITFYSEKMLGSVQILRIFSFAFVFMFISGILGFPLLGAFGYTKETNLGLIFGGIYNAFGLVMLYILHQITLQNVAILATSTYIFMFIHRLYYAQKYKLLTNKGD